MKSSMKRALLPLAVSAAIAAPMSAHATNGMNLEGYGPIATGMGGASSAYDNGTAAMMNNPATLGLMEEDTSRLDLAVGRLGIDITATLDPTGAGMGPMAADSDATAFYMPAVGYVQRDGDLSYGFGVFAQGGMGTEYASDTWMADPSGGDLAGTALTNRSEVGVGRAMVPVAMNVSEQLTIGGSIDFVWAMMDLKMAMNETQFVDMADNMSGTGQNIGMVSGTMVDAFGAMYEPFGGNGISRLYYAGYDFSNGNDFTGQALGTGFAGKLGFTYQVADGVTVGASYHTKTRLGDMETDDATVSMGVNIDSGVAGGGAPSGNYIDTVIPLRGKLAVKDFQWPATFAAGIAIQATDDLMIAADVKRIQWADVMKDFNMVFTADNDAAVNGGFAGAVLDATLYQNWDDQTVYQLGAAYDMSDAFTIRVGANLSDNPVPDTYMNALFPATIENNYTVGFGLNLGEGSDLNFSMTVTPEAKNTNPGFGTASDGDEIQVTHKQINWQLMYSASF